MNLVAITGFVFGLCAGSFLNVVISRLPLKESFTSGRSQCPYCRKKIVWYDLIPVVSFFALRGRCRSCKKPISWRYPFVELGAGLGLAGVLSLSYSPVALLWISGVFLITFLIAIYDIRYKVIPDAFTVIALIWVLGGNILLWRDTIKTEIFAGIGVFVFFFLLYAVSSGRWIGGGDVKLGFVLGLWLGWPGALVMLFVAYIGGAFLMSPLILLKKVGFKAEIPFAPILVVASWAAFLWADHIVDWYFSLIW